MNRETKSQVTDSINASKQTSMSGSLGVIISYDRNNNTATVAITQSDSDEIREILNNVPCPVVMGVQTVAPEPGRLCWLNFKNGNITSPMVIHYYNHRYQQFDYERQYRTGFDLPMS